MPDEITQQAPPRLSWRAIGTALRYPAQRGPLLFLALMALCLTVKPLGDGLLGRWPPLLAGMQTPLKLAWGVLGLGALLMLPNFFSGIVRRVGQGNDEAPDQPQLSQLQSMIMPALKMIIVVLWSFLPLVLYWAALRPDQRPSPTLVLVLLAVANWYLPMSLLLQVMTGELWPSLLPSNVIDSIVRTFASYGRVWLLMLATTLLLMGSVLLSLIPVAGPTLATFGGLYLLTSALHALGRFYRLEKETLGWGKT
jgi:hypothetical protein